MGTEGDIVVGIDWDSVMDTAGVTMVSTFSVGSTTGGSVRFNDLLGEATSSTLRTNGFTVFIACVTIHGSGVPFTSSSSSFSSSIDSCSLTRIIVVSSSHYIFSLLLSMVR